MNDLTEVRLHGRGGQGVVLAATAIAEAAFLEGKSVQSFGIFGAERRGAPVAAFARVGDKPLMPRCQIKQPDIVVVFDTKLSRETIMPGLKNDGLLLLNASANSDERKRYRSLGPAVWLVDATRIALRNGLGGVGIPIINTVMLGALAKLGLYTFDSLQTVLQQKLPHVLENNLAAAKDGYDSVKELRLYDYA